MTAAEVDLGKYVATLRRWAWVLVAGTLLAAGLSFVVSRMLPKTYMTSITLLVGDDTANTHPSLDDVTVSQRLAGVYAGMVTREPILTGVVETLHLPTTWPELQRRVLVIRADGTQLIEIRVADTDPGRAKATAGELGRQLIMQSPTRESLSQLEDRQVFVEKQLAALQANIQNAEATVAQKEQAAQTETSARSVLDLRDQIKALQLNLTNWRSAYAALLSSNVVKSPNTLTIIQPAVMPTASIAPNVPMNVLAGAAFGFLIVLTAAFVIDAIQGERLGSAEDVVRVLDLPVLGRVRNLGQATGPADRLVVGNQKYFAASEDYRRLRSNIQFAWQAEEPVLLMVTSPSADEGKSVTSANLAVAFARAGKTTILVDADLQRPSAHELFGLPNGDGLLSIFYGTSAPTDRVGPPMDMATAMRRRLAATLVQTRIPGLRLLPAGSSTAEDVSDLLPIDDMRHLLDALRTAADVIIVDAPPVLSVAETINLTSIGVGVLAVVEAGQTRADAARMMNDALIHARAHILGAVLNKARVGKRNYPYGEYRRKRGESGRLRVVRESRVAR